MTGQRRRWQPIKVAAALNKSQRGGRVEEEEVKSPRIMNEELLRENFSFECDACGICLKHALVEFLKLFDGSCSKFTAIEIQYVNG